MSRRKGYNYCTCIINAKNKVENSNSRKIRLVEACEDGICSDCGYYTISSPTIVKDSTELYYMLRGYKDDKEVENYYLDYDSSLVSVAVESQTDRKQEGSKYSNRIIK